ncbi:MAG: glycosyltransferase [Tissierellia bacterium]|nr:glycosyltransferase [Tissierellia bacterium]
MKVCIIRNAESRTNASIMRVLDALLTSGRECILLTRTREVSSKKVQKKKFRFKDHEIDEYEIGIKAKPESGLKNIHQLVTYQFAVFRWLIKNKNKYDIIHSYDLDSGIPTCIVSKIIKKKYIYHIADFYVDSRGSIPHFLKHFVRKLEFAVINRAEATIICTEKRKRQIKGSKAKKLVVVHNVPVFENQIEVLSNEDHGLRCTYVGNLSESRFILQVLNVFRKHPDINLEIAGLGALEDEVIRASQQCKNIKFYGKMDYDKTFILYQNSDLMFAIYDPKVENHKYCAPNKLYEAMKVGKPLIVAKGTGVDEIVEEENMGQIINYNESEFEELLIKIRDNPKYLSIWSNNAKKAYEKYSWEEMRSRIIKLYDDI